MQLDYLIVGQGLAGSLLSHSLLQRGVKIMVITDAISSASHVAAGMYNPITGKRKVTSWRADVFFPYMESYYAAMEKFYNCKLLYPKAVYKPFASIEEQNTWYSAHDGDRFVNTSIANSKYEKFVHAPFGGFETKFSGHVDIPELIRVVRLHLESNNCFLKEEFDVSKFSDDSDGIVYKGIKAKRIIFCDGVKATTNPFFSWLPFVPSKGETLNVKIDFFTEEVIFNKQVFAIPLGNNNYRVGSTYAWDYSDEKPTEAGKVEMSDRLSQMIKMPFEILKHEAGIRPTVKDRKPIIGFHPVHSAIGIFNGLGTKGVSLAPYFADEFASLLLNNQQLDPDVSIERFYSLYSRS